MQAAYASSPIEHVNPKKKDENRKNRPRPRISGARDAAATALLQKNGVLLHFFLPVFQSVLLKNRPELSAFPNFFHPFVEQTGKHARTLRFGRGG